MTARDITHGRRAGAWAGPTADELLAEIERSRRRAGNKWPTGDTLDRGPRTPDEWEGRARMAAARHPDNRNLTDLTALERHPTIPRRTA